MTIWLAGTKFRNWLIRYGKRIGIAAAGHTVKRIVGGILFDTFIYGAVVAYCTLTWGPVWGSLAGFAIMTPLAALMCYGWMRLYDWLKLDLFGLEALKQLRETRAVAGRWSRLIHRIARMGNLPAFLALSIQGDAMLVVVYLRDGVEKYDGLSSREWRIFWASLILSNAYWTLRWSIIVEVARLAWNFLF